MAKELPEETKERIRQKAISDVAMIMLTHGIKIENQSKSMIAAILAVYSAGLAQGVKECIIIQNTPIDPEDIQF